MDHNNVKFVSNQNIVVLEKYVNNVLNSMAKQWELAI